MLIQPSPIADNCSLFAKVLYFIMVMYIFIRYLMMQYPYKRRKAFNWFVKSWINTKKKIINAGVISFGNAGQTFLAPFIDANPGFNLKKISTSDPAKADKAKAIYPNTTVVGNADDIINDTTIELVVIGTPNTSHLSLAKQALLAGKHVMVEKPFTITSADADELIALAKQTNRILTVHHNRRFDS